MKELRIQPDLRISDLKKQFNDLFPYLKLEFFNSPHESNEGSPKKDLINDGKLLSELGINETKTIAISSDVTATQLEELFQTEYGASMQVFWKSGNIWLETIQYDNLELPELNLHAEERTEKRV